MLFFITFLTSIIFPMFGQGGGAVYVPLFNLMGEFDFYHAVALSQILIFTSSLVAIFIYHRARLISWPLFFVIEAPTILGALLGGFISALVPIMVAKLLFISLVFLSGLSMVMRKGNRQKEENVFDFQLFFRQNRIKIAIGMIFMFFAGSLAGLLGIGGGVIKVPVMTLFLGIPIKIAAATSGLMVGFTALSGMVGHKIAGQFSITEAIPFVILVFIGANIGARIGVRLDKRLFKRFIGLLLMFISILYAFLSF